MMFSPPLFPPPSFCASSGMACEATIIIIIFIRDFTEVQSSSILNKMNIIQSLWVGWRYHLSFVLLCSVILCI